MSGGETIEFASFRNSVTTDAEPTPVTGDSSLTRNPRVEVTEATIGECVATGLALVSIIRPKMTMSMSADPTPGEGVAPGETITYALWCKNIGNTGATQVQIDDEMPNADYVTFVSGSCKYSPDDGCTYAAAALVSATDGVTATYSAASNTLTFEFDDAGPLAPVAQDAGVKVFFQVEVQ